MDIGYANGLKNTNIAKLDTTSLIKLNDLPQEFTDNAIVSFDNRLRSCVAAAGGHSELLTKSSAKAHLLFVNIFNVQQHVHLKKRTFKF